MSSKMVVALYMPMLNLAMHPRAGRGQHNHPPWGRFGFTAAATIMHIRFVKLAGIMAFPKQPLFGGD
jgi:hypothetical protein